MASPSPSRPLSQIVKDLGFQPITQKSILDFYLPGTGAISYTALSINVIDPNLASKVFCKTDITNFLLISSLCGTGLYIYRRPHMKPLSNTKKISYSLFGSFMFNFGSVLVWAVMRSIYPENHLISAILGVATSITLIKTGKSYLSLVDGEESETGPAQ